VEKSDGCGKVSVRLVFTVESVDRRDLWVVSTLSKEVEESAYHKHKGQQESNHETFDHWFPFESCAATASFGIGSGNSSLCRFVAGDGVIEPVAR
jgi:hypothetical protein